jgi:glycosyltransferase involved in cell wall biosynthesis
MTSDHAVAVVDAARPTLTVVIPVRNDAVALRRCLKALSWQALPADEVLVVDNGSTDDSAEVARRFGARVIAEPRPGILTASATGYDSARGDLIARLDADSLPHPRWVERVHESFAFHPGTSAVTGSAYFFDGPWALRGLAVIAYLDSYFLLMHAALGHVPLFGSNFAFRRSVWLEVRDEVHRFDPMVHDDIDLSFHIGPIRRIRYDRLLRLGISMRPLTHPGGIGLRFRRAFHTLTLHWPEQFPWLRWGRRIRAALRKPVRRSGIRRSSRSR